jgi:hypothetical protein
MTTQTTIISNGSRWFGEEPATIDELVEILKVATLEDRFFGKYQDRREEEPKTFVLCPISKKEGTYWFFGNFEENSHVFNIETNDAAVIAKLRAAIMANKGWKQYIGRCKYLAA